MKIKRVLLKLSGEAISGTEKSGISEDILLEYAQQIKEVAQTGVEIGIVIGGGNIFRGLKGLRRGFDRVLGDQMGMLATVINSLALQSYLQSTGQAASVFTSIAMEPVGIAYSNQKAMKAMKQGEVVIIAGGTGNPFFTTDSASALRAVELEADILLKGTRVDGVYSDDPEKNPKAVKYENITFDEVYKKNLKVMDLTAFTLCKENNLPVAVFDMTKTGNLKKIVAGENIGSVIKRKE